MKLRDYLLPCMLGITAVATQQSIAHAAPSAGGIDNSVGVAAGLQPKVAPAQRPDGAALIRAAYAGDFKTVQALIKAGADVNATDENGYTALHWAAYKGFAGMASYLVSYGASIDPVDSQECTPLMLAAAQKRGNVVKTLIGAGASMLKRSKEGFTALDYANGEPETTTLFSVGSYRGVFPGVTTLEEADSLLGGNHAWKPNSSYDYNGDVYTEREEPSRRNLTFEMKDPFVRDGELNVTVVDRIVSSIWWELPYWPYHTLSETMSTLKIVDQKLSAYWTMPQTDDSSKGPFEFYAMMPARAVFRVQDGHVIDVRLYSPAGDREFSSKDWGPLSYGD